MLQTDQHRPDRQPMPGDPLRDPNKNPGKINPSREDVNKKPERVKENKIKKPRDKNSTRQRPN